MTLVFSVRSKDSLWVVADRRLSYGGRRPVVDDAVKMTILETADGVGVLTYAGLGATAKGTEPSEWMSAVLRGRRGLKFEQSLGVLADVATKELPRHLAPMPVGAHVIMIPAFIEGIGARLYSIDNVIDQQTKQHWYRYTSHQITGLPGSPCPRIAIAGSGAAYIQSIDRARKRALLSLVNENDRGRVSDQLIADQLAALNYETHRAVHDGTVGPRSIVVWRRRPEVGGRRGGGGHQFYTRENRDRRDLPAIPTIGNGMDVSAVGGIFMDQLHSKLTSESWPPANFDLDLEEIGRRLGALPDTPDEKLR